MAEKCPLCDGRLVKAIYWGLPHRLCENLDCNFLGGMWSALTIYLPCVNGDGFMFMTYEGAYLPALWHWLTGDPDDTEE